MKGIKRFKQMVEDQEDFCNGEFYLPYPEAKKIAKEIADELAQLSWAESVPTPKDADGVSVPLDVTELYTATGLVIPVLYIYFFEGQWRVNSEGLGRPFYLKELHYNEPGEEPVKTTAEKGAHMENTGIDVVKDGESYLAYPKAKKTAKEIEEELSWVAGVPAPVDADGNVVPLATEVLYNGAGRKLKVRDIQFTREGAYQWTAYCIPQGRSVADLFIINCTYLHCPESWEQLEKDAKLAPRAYLEERGLDPEKNDRVAFMATDLIRRAKAIAERDKGDK